MFSTLTLLLIYITFGFPAALLGVPYTLATHDISWMYRTGMRITSLGVRAAGIRIRLSGVENMPPGQACIFMANHVSNLDPPVLLPLIPGRIVVMLKKSLMNIPMLGTAMRMAKFIPVERGARREAARASVAQAAQALAEGLHIVVFPEGTRSPNGRLSTFKKGPFFLARENNAPVIPVAISGTERALPKNAFSIRPGPVHIQLLPAIFPDFYATREDLMAAVHAAIAAALPPEMQPLSPGESPTTH